MKYKCDCCNKEINIFPSELKYKKHIFCSKLCKNKYHSLHMNGLLNPNYNSIINICNICGKEFTTTNSRLLLGKGKYCSKKCYHKSISIRNTKEKHPNWKGGITPIIKLFRASREYKNWRLCVFKKDNFKCCACGDNSGGNLHAHHINFLSTLISQYTPKTLQDFLNNPLFLDVSNGITLCETCHYNLHYGDHYE